MRGAFRRDLDAIGDLLRFVDRFAAENAIEEKLAFATRLVIEELFANQVRHARGGRQSIDVSLSLDRGRLVMTITDFDVEPFDHTGVKPVDVKRPLGERTAGGLGLHFVRSLFDDLTYEYSSGNMCVTATKDIGGGDA
jgi:serine/threonine-protein kinase RsbW